MNWVKWISLYPKMDILPTFSVQTPNFLGEKEKNRSVTSNRPPPPSVEEVNILMFFLTLPLEKPDGEKSAYSWTLSKGGIWLWIWTFSKGGSTCSYLPRTPPPTVSALSYFCVTFLAAPSSSIRLVVSPSVTFVKK